MKWFIHEAPNTLRIEQPHFQHSLASATAIRNNHKDIYEYLCLSPELEANEINNIKKPNRQCLAGGQSFDLIGNLIQTRKKDTAFIVIDTIRKKQKYLNISLGKNKILKALNKSFDDEIMHYVMKDQDVERTLNYVEQNKTLQTGPVAAWLKETLLRKTIEAPNPLRKQKI